MENPINNNVIDSRDLIEYKEYLEEELVDYYNEYLEDHNVNVEDDEQMDEVSTFDEVDTALEGFYERFEDEINHYEEIESFCSELDDYAPDFKYGEAIIHKDYFQEYCEELLKDCGYLPDNIPSWIEIDFEKTADNMEQDYSRVTYQGDDYLIRSC